MVTSSPAATRLQESSRLLLGTLAGIGHTAAGVPAERGAHLTALISDAPPLTASLTALGQQLWLNISLVRYSPE
jgi:hypothetical protein